MVNTGFVSCDFGELVDGSVDIPVTFSSYFLPSSVMHVLGLPSVIVLSGLLAHFS